MSAYDQYVAEAARKYGLDPRLINAVMGRESGGRVDAKSPVGAQGLMQLMPGTAATLGVTNPLDPRQNIFGGAKYLRQQIDKFGTIPLALAAYNAGPGAVSKYGGIPPYTETQNYVKNIMGDLKGGGGVVAPMAADQHAGHDHGQDGQQQFTMPGPSPIDALRALRASRGNRPALGNGAFGASFNQQAGTSRLDALQQLKQSLNPQTISVGVPAAGSASPAAPNGGAAGAIPLVSGGMAGGVGGDWGGTMQRALGLAQLTGLPITSQKRDRHLTASGNPSDHWKGSSLSYAVDLGVTGAAGDRAAMELAQRLGIPNYQHGQWANFTKDGYRYQLGWKTPGHYDHIHLGVRKI